MWVSAKLSPARVTRIRTSPGPGSGRGQLGKRAEPPVLRTRSSGSRAWGEASEVRCAPAPRSSPSHARTARAGCSKVRAHVDHSGRVDRLRHASRRPSASASACSAAPPCTSPSRPRSSRTCASWGRSGEDFGEDELEVMRSRGVDVSDIERVAGGQDVLLAGRVRLGPQLARDARHPAGRVRGLRSRSSPSARAASDVLFLANIQPELQRDVRGQLPARPLRGARLDEPVDRRGARLARGGDREGRLRDPQRRRAAPADRQAQPDRGRPRGARLGRRARGPAAGRA